MARGGGREPGTWKCRNCSRYNRPSMQSCRECGEAKPPPKPPRPKRVKPKLKERSAKAKAAEKASGVGSNGLRKGMSEHEKKLARGKALRCTPLANDIERRVRDRLAREAKEQAVDA